MTIQTIRTEIEQRLVDNYSDLSNARFPNQPFDTNRIAPWIDFTVTFRNGLNVGIRSSAIKNVCVRRLGAIVANAYVKPDTGTISAEEKVDELIEIFENVNFGKIHTRSADVRAQGQITTEGNNPQLWVYSVRIPFYSDE